MSCSCSLCCVDNFLGSIRWGWQYVDSVKRCVRSRFNLKPNLFKRCITTIVINVLYAKSKIQQFIKWGCFAAAAEEVGRHYNNVYESAIRMSILVIGAQYWCIFKNSARNFAQFYTRRSWWTPQNTQHTEWYRWGSDTIWYLLIKVYKCSITLEFLHNNPTEKLEWETRAIN